MWTPSSDMDANLHGFDTKPTPPIKVVVGAERKALYPPRNLLLQIPYFAEMGEIVNGDVVERRLRLKDVDPATVADLFQFVSLGTVPDLTEATQNLPQDQRQTAATRYIKAYITARQWELYWIMGSIRKELVVFHRFNLVNPGDAYELYNVDLEHGLLYKFLISELSHEIGYNYPDRVKDEVNYYDNYMDMPIRVLWDVLEHVNNKPSECANCKNCQDCGKLKQPALQDEWLSETTWEERRTWVESKPSSSPYTRL